MVPTQNLIRFLCYCLIDFVISLATLTHIKFSCKYIVLFRKPQCHYARTCTTMTRINIQFKDFDDFTHPDSHKIYKVIFSFVNIFLFTWDVLSICLELQRRWIYLLLVFQSCICPQWLFYFHYVVQTTLFLLFLGTLHKTIPKLRNFHFETSSTFQIFQRTENAKYKKNDYIEMWTWKHNN